LATKCRVFFIKIQLLAASSNMHVQAKWPTI